MGDHDDQFAPHDDDAHFLFCYYLCIVLKALRSECSSPLMVGLSHHMHLACHECVCFGSLLLLEFFVLDARKVKGGKLWLIFLN